MTVFELYLHMGEGDFDPGRVEAQLDLLGDLPFGLEEIIGRHITVEAQIDRTVPQTVHKNAHRPALQDIFA